MLILYIPGQVKKNSYREWPYFINLAILTQNVNHADFCFRDVKPKVSLVTTYYTFEGMSFHTWCNLQIEVKRGISLAIVLHNK